MTVQETILKYKVDSASQKQAIESLNAVANAGVKVNESISKSAIQTQSLLTRTYADERDAVGDLSTSFGALGSVTSAFGDSLAGLTEGFRVTGDALGFAEYIPNFADSVKVLGNNAFASTGLLGGMAQGLYSLVPALGATGAGLGAIGLAIAPIALVAVGVASALEQSRQAMENMRIEAEKQAKAIVDSADATAQARQLIQQGNYKELENLEAQAQNDVKQTAEQLAIVKGEMQSIADSLAVSFDPQLNATLQALGKEYLTLQNQLKEQQNTASAYLAVLTSEEAQLARTSEATVKYNDTISATEKNLSDLDSVLAQIKDTASSRELQDTREAQDRAIKSGRDFIDYLEELVSRYSDHKDALEQIEADGAKRIEDIRKETANKITEITQRQEQLQSDYYKRQADELSKFNTEQIRRQEDYQLKAKRAQEDFQQSQIDAVLNNDASAFLRNQRQFTVSSARGAEDKAIEDKRRQEDFNARQQDDARRLEEQKAQLDKELNAFIENQALKVQAEQSAIQERLDAEKEAYQLSLDDYLDKRAKAQAREDEDFRLSQQRRDEDRAIEDTRRAEQLTLILSQIDLKTVAELNAMQKVIDLSNTLTALLPSSNNLPSAYQNSAIPAPSTGGVTVNVGAVGEVTTPTQLNDTVNAIINAVTQGIQKAKQGK